MRVLVSQPMWRFVPCFGDEYKRKRVRWARGCLFHAVRDYCVFSRARTCHSTSAVFYLKLRCNIHNPTQRLYCYTLPVPAVAMKTLQCGRGLLVFCHATQKSERISQKGTRCDPGIISINCPKDGDTGGGCCIPDLCPLVSFVNP